MPTCGRHAHERSTGRCRSCGVTGCEACLVWTHGPSRAPECVACALAAAGAVPVERTPGALTSA